MLELLHFSCFCIIIFLTTFCPTFSVDNHDSERWLVSKFVRAATSDPKYFHDAPRHSFLKEFLSSLSWLEQQRSQEQDVFTPLLFSNPSRLHDERRRLATVTQNVSNVSLRRRAQTSAKADVYCKSIPN